ncbi:hypothetical protein ACQKMV_19535 [Lysinibacillus sp. NPDC094403]|uniref:hypothetical protein n=1 Tax=Lysinibacillus sp. NPDC094403 TaxID=3390581 RepID=UPI003D066AAC
MEKDGNIHGEPLAQMRLALKNILKNLESVFGTSRFNEDSLFWVEEINTAQRKQIINAFFGDHLPCVRFIPEHVR